MFVQVCMLNLEFVPLIWNLERGYLFGLLVLLLGLSSGVF